MCSTVNIIQNILLFHNFNKHVCLPKYNEIIFVNIVCMYVFIYLKNYFHEIELASYFIGHIMLKCN